MKKITASAIFIFLLINTSLCQDSLKIKIRQKTLKELKTNSSDTSSDTYFFVKKISILNNGKIASIGFSKNSVSKKAKISIFIFTHEQNPQLTQSFFDVYDFYSYSILPMSDEIVFYPLIDNFLITIRIDYLEVNYAKTQNVCFYYDGKELNYAGEFTLSYSDKISGKKEYTEWFSTMDMIEKTGLPPDFLLNIRGKKNGELFTETKCYSFDGEKYREK